MQRTRKLADCDDFVFVDVAFERFGLALDAIDPRLHLVVSRQHAQDLVRSFGSRGRFDPGVEIDELANYELLRNHGFEPRLLDRKKGQDIS